jgi:hypothetical protein
MPREQKLGVTTNRRDQYSLAMVFTLIISQNMIDIDSIKNKSVIDNMLESVTIDENLRNFIKIMINDDSTERFQSIEHALNLFNKISSGEEVEIKIKKVSKNATEDDYIAKQIVKNEMFYAEIDDDKYGKKNKKSYKALFYIVFFSLWIYGIYHFIGSLMLRVEEPRHYGNRKNNYNRYRKNKTKQNKIKLDTYNRADIDKGKK